MILPLVLFISLARLSSAKCFYPDATEATDDVQCQPGENSACCGQGSICLSNGLCMQVIQPFGISRGSCTNPTFEIDECTSACTGYQRSTGIAIISYNNGPDGIFYCCNSIVNNASSIDPACSMGEPFTLDNADVIPGAGVLEDYIRKSDVNSTASQNDTTSTLTATPTPTPVPAPDSDSDSNTVAVGAGVGVPLGVIALAGIGWALWERRKRKVALQLMSPGYTSVMGTVKGTEGFQGFQGFQHQSSAGTGSQSDRFSHPMEMHSGLHSQRAELAESPVLSGSPRLM
ncbi:hypothetical protein BDV18DRAFT_156617 [Aspergillus unguis]